MPTIFKWEVTLLAKYKLKYWFEYGGICIWGVNAASKDKFGYAIETISLPISDSLIEMLNKLEEEYHSYLDWDYPPNPSPWTEEHKQDFIRRATNAHERLCKELGENYEVENEVTSCV
jgi:hypothetical protein